MTKKKTPLGGQASLPFPEVTGASAASALPERGSGGGDEGEKGVEHEVTEVTEVTEAQPAEAQSTEAENGGHPSQGEKGVGNANTSDELAYVLTIEGNGHEAAALLEQAGVEVKSLRRVDQGDLILGPGDGLLLDFVLSIAAEDEDGRCSECDEPWGDRDPEYPCCTGQQATMVLLRLGSLAATKWSCQTCGERVAFSGALTCSEECDRIRIHREVEDD